MAFNKYSALATDAERPDFDCDFVETSHAHILGSPMLSPRLNRASSSVNRDDVTRDNLVGIVRCLSMDSTSDATARSRSFDSSKFRESPARNTGTERRVSFSDVRVVHDVDDDDDGDDDDDLSVSFNRLFDLDQSESKGDADADVPPKVDSASGDDRGELARAIEKCETLETENVHLTQQLRGMRTMVESHRQKLDSQATLVASSQEEVANLQRSLWASVTGSQPRLSTFESQMPTVVQRRRANTELGPSSPPKPKPKPMRARAHTEAGIGHLALPPKNTPPNQKKKRPSFSAFFGRSQSAENSDAEEAKTLIESQEEKEVVMMSLRATATTTRMRTQSEAMPLRSSPSHDIDESPRVRSKSYPFEHEGSTDDDCENSVRDRGGSSYPALQHQVSVLESKLMSSRKKRQEREDLEKKFLDMKLEHATKCAEFEELQLQFSANAKEQQSVVNDLNTALVDKMNMKSQVDQLRDRLEDLTKDYQLLQQNHLRLQNHIDATSRKSSVSVSSATSTSTPTLPAVATSWRMSLARRFSSLTSTVDDHNSAGEEVAGRKLPADKNRERSKTHHGHGHRHRKKHRKGKHSKHAAARSKSEVTTGTRTSANTDEAIESAQEQQQIGRNSLRPLPLFLATKSPKEKLGVLAEEPSGDHTDFDDNADVHLSEFRGWFGGAANGANVKTSKNGYNNLHEELSHATTSPLLTHKTVELL